MVDNMNAIGTSGYSGWHKDIRLGGSIANVLRHES